MLTPAGRKKEKKIARSYNEVQNIGFYPMAFAQLVLACLGLGVTNGIQSLLWLPL